MNWVCDVQVVSEDQRFYEAVFYVDIVSAAEATAFVEARVAEMMPAAQIQELNIQSLDCDRSDYEPAIKPSFREIVPDQPLTPRFFQKLRSFLITRRN